MPKYLLKGGQVIDPVKGTTKKSDVLISGRDIDAIGTGLKAGSAKVIDCKGCYVVPGLIDLHVHLREPGHDEEETIASGLEAAIHGGYAAVAAMPDTNPPVDSEAAVEYLILQASRAGKAKCYPVGAVTVRCEGDSLCEMGLLSRAGVVAFSDVYASIDHSGVMLRAMEYAGMCGHPIISMCQDKHLGSSGVMASGEVQTRLGFSGIPGLSEELALYRDMALAEQTGTKIHIGQVSTAKSVQLIREAKKRGVRVTAGVTPHHLLLEDTAIEHFDTKYKVQPPLRTKADRAALLKGLKDGTIDVIVSGHAPVSKEAKAQEFTEAPFGAIGLESTLPVLLTELVGKKKLGLAQLIKAMSSNAAAVLGLPGGSLSVGERADVTIIDPTKSHTIDAEAFKSHSCNCPFDGFEATGRACGVFVDGKYHRLP